MTPRSSTPVDDLVPQVNGQSLRRGESAACRVIQRADAYDVAGPRQGRAVDARDAAGEARRERRMSRKAVAGAEHRRAGREYDRAGIGQLLLRDRTGSRLAAIVGGPVDLAHARVHANEDARPAVR